MTGVAPNNPNSSPLKLLFTLAALILATETLVMFLMKLLALDSPLADAVVLTALILPSLYMFVFRPMVRQMNESQSAMTAAADNAAQARQITEAAVDAFIAMDIQGMITDWNPAAESIFGWSRAEAVGRTVNDTIMPPRMREAHPRGLAHFLATGEGPVIGKRLELTARHRDGHELPVEIIISAIRTGDLWRFTAFLHDITKRRQLEADVRRSENRYRTLFESSRDAVMILEPPDWRFSSGNEATLEMFGAQDEQHFVALGPWEFSPERQPDGRGSEEKSKEMIETALRNGSNFFEWTHRKISGELFSATVLLSRMEIDGKNYLQATVRDITERKNLGEAVEQLSRQVRTILNSAGEGILGLDLEGKHTFINPIGATLLGYEVDELIGRHSHSLWHHTLPDGKPYRQEDCPIYRAFTDGLVHRVDTEVFWRKDGTSFPVNYMSTPVRDEQGALRGAVVVFRDITEQKRAGKALWDKNKELEQVAYATSHDLRSPLVTIQTFLDHLKEDIAAQDADLMAKDLGFIKMATDKMEQLLDELGKLLRVGPRTSPLEDVQLEGVVKEVLNLVAGRISQRGIPVTVAPQSIMLHGNQAHFVAIFQNLVDNACKFMGDQKEPRIEIGIKRENEGPVFFVCDNGSGIDAHGQAEMFGLFVRFNPQVEGTGLGLALVKRIVELYGGRIWVESAGLGQGACFYFTLPGAVGQKPAASSQQPEVRRQKIEDSR
jgi:PAS domain S-box-containing protein